MNLLIHFYKRFTNHDSFSNTQRQWYSQSVEKATPKMESTSLLNGEAEYKSERQVRAHQTWRSRGARK